MAAAIGFLMIIVIVALLLKGKMSPIVVLAIVPTISALILGFVPTDILGFIADGIKTTTSNGILFIFSVIYFGVLSDTGLFDVIVNWLVKKAGNNVIAVTVVTAMIATIAHLDGTTAVTVLITIPAMYPVYKRMNIDARILLCITGACMGVMNLLPWGGPTARAATVLQMDATELWHMLIPLQIVGLVMNSVIAVLLGMYAVKKGAGAGKGVEVETNEKEKAESGPALSGVRFLCAEDNEMNAVILEANLKCRGASCRIFPDGKSLVDYFAAADPGEYDMILMDVQMPLMNGYEAARAIRKSSNPDGKAIPIIAMTANAFSDDIRACLNAGMDAHVSKPVDMSAFEKTVRSLREDKKRLVQRCKSDRSTYADSFA